MDMNGVLEIVAAATSGRLAIAFWEKATGRRDPGSLGPGLCWVICLCWAMLFGYVGFVGAEPWSLGESLLFFLLVMGFGLVEHFIRVVDDDVVIAGMVLVFMAARVFSAFGVSPWGVVIVTALIGLGAGFNVQERRAAAVTGTQEVAARENRDDRRSGPPGGEGSRRRDENGFTSQYQAVGEESPDGQ